MAGIMDSLKNLVGLGPAANSAPAAISPEEYAALVAQHQAIMQEQQEQALATTQATETPVANDTPSLTEAAEKTLRRMLMNHKVTRYLPNGTTQLVDFPVGKIMIGGHHAEAAHAGNAHSWASPVNLAVRHGERSTSGEHGNLHVTIELSAKETDFDQTQLQLLFQREIAKIPALQGHVKLDEPKKNVTYKEIAAELEPRLAALVAEGKLSAGDKAQINGFFAGHGDDAAAHVWHGDAIHVRHEDGKVSTKLNVDHLPEDKKSAKAPDAEIVEYFDKHKPGILAAIKKEALALGIPELSAPGALDNLDIVAHTSDWGVSFDFGTKPAGDIDPATGQKLSHTEYAKKMTETPLAKISKEKMAEIMHAALFEGNHPLPPITSHVATGVTMGKILRHRTHNDSVILSLLEKHDVFKTYEQMSEVRKNLEKQDISEVQTPHFSTSAHDKPLLGLGVDLPKGVTLQQALQGLVANHHALTTPPQTGAALGVAA